MLTHCIGLQLIYAKQLVYMTHQFLQYGAHSPGELSSTNCQKRPSTIRLRYLVPGITLAGTGFKKIALTKGTTTGTRYPVIPTLIQDNSGEPLLSQREQPLDFYKPDILPAAQPIVSKHYRNTQWFGRLLFYRHGITQHHVFKCLTNSVKALSFR